jgi:hypothetical protein
VTVAELRSNVPVPALLLLQAVRLALVAANGVGLSLMIPSPLSQRVDVGSLMTTLMVVFLNIENLLGWQ